MAVLAMGLLVGCEEGSLNNIFTNTAPPGAAADGTESAPVQTLPASGALVEQDVEAPDVFAVNESGLWDGRPSLGGVWIAHPDVADPERVMIRNEANGQSVVGALFRRERDIPGPRIQVSSDAAQALGMLAGQPTVLDVIALRRESIQVAPPVGTDVGVDPVDSEIEAEPLETAEAEDPIAAAAAAIAAAEAAGETTIEAAPEVEIAAVEAPAAEPEVIEAVPDLTQTDPLRRPFVQIGIFNVEDNATETADNLRAAGLIPTVRQQEASGTAFWRVIVGPSNTEAERSEVLAKVRELGFEDAYFVTN